MIKDILSSILKRKDKKPNDPTGEESEVGGDITEGADTEKCVLCGTDTGIRKDLDIKFRIGYIEGSGQLCNKCFFNVYADEI